MDMKTMEKLEEGFNRVLHDNAERGFTSASSVELVKTALSGLVKLKMLEEMERYDSGRSTRHYSMEGNMPHTKTYDEDYSGHSIKDRMIAKMEDMYGQAKTEHERHMIDEWINKLSSNN